MASSPQLSFPTCELWRRPAPGSFHRTKAGVAAGPRLVHYRAGVAGVTGKSELRLWRGKTAEPRFRPCPKRLAFSRKTWTSGPPTFNLRIFVCSATVGPWQPAKFSFIAVNVTHPIDLHDAEPLLGYLHLAQNASTSQAPMGGGGTMSNTKRWRGRNPAEALLGAGPLAAAPARTHKSPCVRPRVGRCSCGISKLEPCGYHATQACGTRPRLCLRGCWVDLGLGTAGTR